MPTEPDEATLRAAWFMYQLAQRHGAAYPCGASYADWRRDVVALAALYRAEGATDPAQLRAHLTAQARSDD